MSGAWITVNDGLSSSNKDYCNIFSIRIKPPDESLKLRRNPDRVEEERIIVQNKFITRFKKMTSIELPPIDEKYIVVSSETKMEIIDLIKYQNNGFNEVGHSEKTKTSSTPFRHKLCLYIESIKTMCFGIVLFIIISMTVGILMVSLTSSKMNTRCKHIIRPTTTVRKDYNSFPQSIATGYFNNDTLLDFVIANTGTGTIEVFLGFDNGLFVKQTTYETGSDTEPYSVAVGQLNDETGVDIAVANFGTNSINIFIGYNNGTFILYKSFSTGSSRPLFINVADLNNDHHLDLIVLNYGTNSISIFNGLGDASFILSFTCFTGYDSLPQSLAIADLNNDNQSDIVVANTGTNNIGIFFGHGNATFADQQIYYIDITSMPSSVAIADINDDHHLDIIVANYGTSNIGILFGYENGSFDKQIIYSTGSNSHPTFVSIGDFNGDNHLDIFVIDSDNDQAYILPGNVNDTFPLVSICLTGFASYPYSGAVVDLNHDNISDLLIVNHNSNEILVLIEYQMQHNFHYARYNAGMFSFPNSIATGDVNNDNSLDILITNKGNNKVSVFLGSGNGSFSSMTIFYTGSDTYASSIILKDFNNDKQLDIAVISPFSQNINILLGYGNGTFSMPTIYYTGNNSIPSSLSVDDINNDNCLDMVVLNNRSNNMQIFIGNCDGTFVMKSSYDVGSDSTPTALVIGDFNNDNRSDLAIAISSGVINVFLGQGNGTFGIMTTYSTGSNSQLSAIDAADFNNDNRLDIVVTMLSLNRIGIFFGKDDGTFANVKIYRLENSASPNSFVIGDFNDDHHLDIAVNGFTSFNVEILFGNGKGDFPMQSTYPTPDKSFPSDITFGDFNNDNQLDMAVSNYGTNTISILLSFYSANFVSLRRYSTGSGSRPDSLAIGDFNNDKILDIVTANYGTTSIGIRYGLGNGSFELEKTFSTGPKSLPQYINIGDFNRDNQLDIAVADSLNFSIVIFLANSNETIAPPVKYPMNPGAVLTSIAVSDLNKDDWLDLIVTDSKAGDIGILYGYNYATFNLQQIYIINDNSFPNAIAVSDFNKDHRVDIIIANQYLNEISILFGYGNGTFGPQISYSTGDESQPVSIALGDLNNDSCLDIVVANSGTKCLGILLGNCDGTFQSLMTIYSIRNDSKPQTVVVGDVNNDHRLDIILTDASTNNVDVFIGYGDGTFSTITTYSTGRDSQPWSIALGDLNGDDCVDIVVSNMGTNSVSVLIGYCNGSFVLTMTYPLGENAKPYSIALCDFNNDDQLDIAVNNFNYSGISIFLGFGNGSFATLKSYSTGPKSLPFRFTLGDFNNDNQTDIAVVCSGINAFVVLFGTNDGKFLLGTQYLTTTSSSLKSIACDDFNNDSRLDCVVANILDDNMNIFQGNGNEPFGTVIHQSTGTGSQPQFVAIGDFNNDNQSDVAIVNSGTDSIVIEIGSTEQNFQVLATYSTGNGSQPYALVVDDFNDDNQLDIVVANAGTSNIIIFQGYGNGSFVAIGSYSTGVDSRPYSIVASDFNNDKRMDLAVANSFGNDVLILYGLGNGTFVNQTSYPMGYQSYPYSLAVGDFNNNTWMDLAVANYGASNIEILLESC